MSSTHDHIGTGRRRAVRGLTKATTCLAIASVVGAACNSGDAQSSDTTVAPRTTTSAPAQSTTSTTAAKATTTLAPADPSTAKLAQSAVIVPSDFGAGWSEAAPAQPYDVKGIAVDSCINPADKALSDLPFNATAGGPSIAAAGGSASVVSWSAVFPDKKLADEWVSYAASDAFEKCSVEANANAMNRSSTDGKKYTFELVANPKEDANVGTDKLVGSATYYVRLDGKNYFGRIARVYQVGRVVTTVDFDYLFETDAAAAAKSVEQATAATDVMLQRVAATG